MCENSLTNGTRPHSELGVLSRFRVAGQMLAQATFVHVVFTTHRTGMVGRPAFGHVRAGTYVGVICGNEKQRHFTFSER